MTRQGHRRIVRTAMAAVVALLALNRGLLAQDVAKAPIQLPPYKGELKDDYYPPDARQHYRQGRALVEFTLDARGVPLDVVVVNAEPTREFDDLARRLAKNLRYEVPAGWDQSAASHRFRIGVRFQVIECINLSHCETGPRNPPADYEGADRTYVVTAQRRVVIFQANPPAPGPAAQPPAALLPGPQPSTPQPATAPAPPASHNPVPYEEPVYPPG
jgi:TonB family protein